MFLGEQEVPDVISGYHTTCTYCTGFYKLSAAPEIPARLRHHCAPSDDHCFTTAVDLRRQKEQQKNDQIKRDKLSGIQLDREMVTLPDR